MVKNLRGHIRKKEINTIRVKRTTEVKVDKNYEE